MHAFVWVKYVLFDFPRKKYLLFYCETEVCTHVFRVLLVASYCTCHSDIPGIQHDYKNPSSARQVKSLLSACLENIVSRQQKKKCVRTR